MSPRRALEESIQHLQEELADGEPLTSDDRALLHRTLAEVARHLADEDDAEDHASVTESIYEELQELAERVEHTRPTLSVLLGRIVDSLSQLGI